MINLTGGQFDCFEDMLAAASTNADGEVVITIDGKTPITLEGVLIADFHGDDFLFG